MSYISHVQQLLALQNQAVHSLHRCAVVLEGSRQWQWQVLQLLGQSHVYERAILLGEESLDYCESLSFKQARQKIGQESDLIIADFNATFDANGFTAIAGTLKGGGLLVILPKVSPCLASDLWLEDACQSLHFIKETSTDSAELDSHSDIQHGHVSRFTDQLQAIDAVQKVLSGHRKRPLVITADRGRGKSAALGKAAARILLRSPKKIVVTAPSTQAVKTLFEHASNDLGLQAQRNFLLESDNGGSMRFVSPDELLREEITCDLLLVDEAAAIPLPMLEAIVEHYHRVCFATTVHGYEGCGRGFSIKFEAWLNIHRPGWSGIKLTEPIRWSSGDPVEAWLFDTFLLDAEVESFSSSSVTATDLLKLDMSKLDFSKGLKDSTQLRKAFALLINAHYQTSPNDLFQLLDDPNISLYQVIEQSHLVGVVLCVAEGALNIDQMEEIKLGRRRPAGHLVPISVTSYTGDNEPSLLRSLRVMRIAVHPQLQGQGIGSWMLSQLSLLHKNDTDYLSTSFGITDELFHFWQQNAFDAVRLGSKQDKASGCFSAVMVKCLANDMQWKGNAQALLYSNLLDTITDVHQNLPTELVLPILNNCTQVNESLNDGLYSLVSNYTFGGSNFESTRVLVKQLLLEKQPLNSHSNQVRLLTDLCLKKLTWAQTCKQYGFSGRKQAEAEYRLAIQQCLLTRN
ncbi:hypothetical protein A9264_09735 [Vibrio sp. UCD-FRSSP16_10]|uniref:tRNA(Met) cytidine acetyltransferase TmcA n=1 Tax=unclassified Vibrio TaxID=2614977 RepID=UPI000801E475|nr:MULTISPECIES: GNAT family N-acetyltransferase [unclassified Vibrio]OBT16999.1 hypothetical protein A9260_09960 [Vibrio sp. UCD-FRSSP16_30]OBT21990.1 hypothetical protein A9264_09735 [Vibrio sp. UCD-FRSSP16_10]